LEVELHSQFLLRDAELRSQFLLRDDDVALVAYQSHKSIKRALSLLSEQPQALSWLMLV
jgi:hypothetical protein